MAAHRLLYVPVADEDDPEQLLEVTLRLVAACVKFADEVLLPQIAFAMGESEQAGEVRL